MLLEKEHPQHLPLGAAPPAETGAAKLAFRQCLQKIIAFIAFIVQYIFDCNIHTQSLIKKTTKMQVKSAEDGSLTNHEVLDLIQERQQKRLASKQNTGIQAAYQNSQIESQHRIFVEQRVRLFVDDYF